MQNLHYRVLAWALIVSQLAVPITVRGQQPEPSPEPTPQVTESGDVEGQKASLERSRSIAAKAQDSAETSRLVWATATAVCFVGCATSWLGGSGDAICAAAGAAAGLHDVVQVVASKKRFRNAWKELVGSYAAAGTVAGGVAVANSLGAEIKGGACVGAALCAAMTIAKEWPIHSMRDAQRDAEKKLNELRRDDSQTEMSMLVPDLGDGRVNPIEGQLARGGVTTPEPRAKGGGGGKGVSNAATAGCSSFALAKDVSGTASCLERQGEKIPSNFTSSEFAKAFEKASGADLGQFLKAGAGDGMSAESLLKKATANIPSLDRSKFANLAEVMRSELGLYKGGGGGGPARRFAASSDEDKTAVIRADEKPELSFASSAPIDTTLFGRASAQYFKFSRKKILEGE